MIPDFLFKRRRHAESASFRHRNSRKITLIYDPQKAGKWFLPYFLVAAGFLAAIRRARLPWKERLPCYRSLSVWLWKNKRDVYDESVDIIARSLKRHLSEAHVNRLKSLKKRISRRPHEKSEKRAEQVSLNGRAEAGSSHGAQYFEAGPHC